MVHECLKFDFLKELCLHLALLQLSPINHLHGQSKLGIFLLGNVNIAETTLAELLSQFKIFNAKLFLELRLGNLAYGFLQPFVIVNSHAPTRFGCNLLKLHAAGYLDVF